MGIVAGLGAAAAAASLASTVNNWGDTGSGGSQNPTGSYGGNPATYIPTAQPQADQNYQAIFNAMHPYAQALPGQVIPQYQQYAQNIQNNPYAAGQMAGAQQVATLGQQVGAGQFASANQLQTGGNQLMTTAFDPQTALYDRLQNQTMQQAAAANAMSGVAGPYAAGVTNQALQNFNIGWENNQLQRQAQGVQAAGQAYSGAAGLGNLALGTYGTSSSLPYSTYLSQQGNNIGALNSLSAGTTAAFAPSDLEANWLQSYMKLGQSASGLAQQGQNNAFLQNQQMGQQFGQSLEALGGYAQTAGNLFSNWGGSSGGSTYSDPQAWSMYGQALQSGSAF